MQSVSVIGGYLGAGKTTLVNHLLRHADGVKIAVLVNEFGALPIDEDLIEAQDEALISIAGGCVCCSYGNDLIQAMLDLRQLDPAPDHILIETSGVALPGAISASVGIMEGFAVEGVIVLADAETIKKQSGDAYIGDTIERQLSDADLVLLNKSDLVPEEQLDTTKEWLRVMAPNAEVVTARHGKVPNAVVMHPFARTGEASSSSDRRHTPSFESRIIRLTGLHDAQAVAAQLADPKLSLVRAKGFVPTISGLRAVQVVGRRWSVTDAPENAEPGLVVIAQPASAKLDDIEALLAGV